MLIDFSWWSFGDQNQNWLKPINGWFGIIIPYPPYPIFKDLQRMENQHANHQRAAAHSWSSWKPPGGSVRPVQACCCKPPGPKSPRPTRTLWIPALTPSWTTRRGRSVPQGDRTNRRPQWRRGHWEAGKTHAPTRLHRRPAHLQWK